METNALTCKYISTNIKEFDGIPIDAKKNNDSFQKYAVENNDEYWSLLAQKFLWFKQYDKVSDCDFKSGKINWFLNGKLNVSVNCVDVHAKSHPDKVAFIWEKDEPGQQEYVTYKELLEMVCKIANVLKSIGVVKGEAVCFYMPISPISAACMLACARIGAKHSVVFTGFSAKSLADRIIDASCKYVLTADSGYRGGKIIRLKSIVNEAVKISGDVVKHVLVMKRTGIKDADSLPIDLDLQDEMQRASSECEPEHMDSEDPLFVLYTSGSTGKPKGIVHTQAGYLLYAMISSKLVFDLQEGDVHGCVADIGWITGHTYVVYGPLANGVTSVLFESTPVYPHPDRYWEMISRLKITQFYTAPTAIRLLIKTGNSWTQKGHDLSSLKVLGSVGEPINLEAWNWFNEKIGKSSIPIVDTWWQTETGGICISPRPSAPNAEIRPGHAMRPLPGIVPVILDTTTGEELATCNTKGALCLKQPWPGMLRTVHGSHERFKKIYLEPYPGYYFSGDCAWRDQDGYFHISGRLDDVLNVCGHRLGTAEVENALALHRCVAECAVVGVAHEIKGETPFAFVLLKDDRKITSHDVIKQELRDLVKTEISYFAIPDTIMFASGLPKTRSGKIMRRILRKIAACDFDDLGDVSTLADPSVVKSLVDLCADGTNNILDYMPPSKTAKQ